MRLICGILSFEGSIAGRELAGPMCEAMQSPTRRASVNIWSDGPAALGVLDFSREGPDFALERPSTQRAIQRNGAFALAADVRLDNRHDLAETFGLQGATDARLALAALERWETDAPAHMLGDFALACIDRERRTLTLARDIFGVRPIAYHYQPGRYVVFASLPRGLFPSGLVPREIDHLAIGRQVQFCFPAEDTPFRNVRMLSPAHTTTFSQDGEHSRRYWQANLQPQRHGTPEAAADELRELVDTAVRCRLPATGPVAAHLSGGIDSSTICTFASRALKTEVQPRPVHGYSFWPEERPELNLEYERPFVESVLAHDPTIVCHPIAAEPPGVWLHAGSYPDRIHSLSQQDPENAVCQQAAELGADSILSGWGGDEGVTFNGRGALAQAMLTLRWRYLANEMNALQATRGWSKIRVVANEVLPFVIPRPLRQFKYRLRHRQRAFDDRWRDLLQPSLSHALASEDQIQQLRPGPDARHNQLMLLRSGHLAWKATMWATVGAHYGVGFAFPMLDRRLVDFALSVPAQWYIRGGFKRRLIRDATEGILPGLVRTRHNKIIPYPQVLVEIPEQREATLARIRELVALPAVQSIFRVDQIQALANSMPTPEQARTTHRDASAQVLVNLFNVVRCCAFLEATGTPT